MANNNRNDDDRRNRGSQEGDGSMSVREAGQKGGEKGGQRVRELVEEGKQAEGGNRRDDNR
ncbi:MAG TPA: hypothetical protein VM576_05035 [Xanthomonadaceae bacterium]|jgi:hypothetical protein|nr:hypothetical protein [Xanthomonadaceae bacterium]